MKLDRGFHLTYCSNIHPGESWQEVRSNLARFLPEVRRRLDWVGPFGIGLRLSAQAAETLEQPEHLADFQVFLADQDCYVFTINGFPYGVFHRARVKEEVYLPDWRDEARLDYTNRLARILSAILPDEPGLEGSISTVPGAFKAEVATEDDVRAMARMMLRHVAELYRLRERTGRTISLALEPEPCCYLETVDECVSFFREHLRHPELIAELAEALGVGADTALAASYDLIGLCYDACHMAVEFEEAADALRRLKIAEIKICKFQISSALKLNFRAGDGRPAKTLAPFAESTYLHQVVERGDGDLVRYIDLPEGLAQEARLNRDGGGGGVKGWRVHFHVPIFLEEMRNFATTQDHLVDLIDCLKRDPASPYLEVETYTWDVLPLEYKTSDTAGAIARELAWVKERLAP